MKLFIQYSVSITLLLFSNFLIAQTYSHDLGVVTDYERNMKHYDKDTSAEAVVIYNIGESSFYRADEGFDLAFKRQTKIKVLKESYLNNAEYSILIYKGNQGKEEIRKFEATTYNFKNGQVIKTVVNKDQLYTEKINKHWDRVKFAMPNVQIGSVIEFKYEINSPFKFLLKDWEFQDYIPTVYSEYKTKMIPFYVYQYRLQGATKFDEFNEYEDHGFQKQFYDVKYRDKVYQFIMKNIPAFKDEPFITSRNDYILKLDFQLSVIHHYGGGSVNVLSTWPELSKELENDTEFGVYINRSKNNFKKASSKLELISKTDKEKAQIIVNYIKQNYNYNGHSGIFTSKTINKFIKEKTGNVAEINLYLIGALKSQGIETYPVILSTRKNGKIITKYPFTDPFNYVLAYAKIDNKMILLDATDPFYPYDKIPVKCYNDLGFIINKKEPKWLKIRQNRMSTSQFAMKSVISSEGDSINGNFELSSVDYDAVKYRKKFNNKTTKIEDYFIDENIELSDTMKTENYEDVEKPYIINFNFTSLTDRINNKILIDPLMNLIIKDNPLKTKTRSYPIDMIYPKSKFYENTITIPENYKPDKLPENFFFNTQLFSLVYNVTQENNTIKISASYQFKKAVYSPEDYTKIKRYFEIIIKKLNQKLVIEKIN